MYLSCCYLVNKQQLLYNQTLRCGGITGFSAFTHELADSLDQGWQSGTNVYDFSKAFNNIHHYYWQ